MTNLPEYLPLLFLLLGLLVGTLSAWLIAKFKYAAQMLSPKTLEDKYVPRAVHLALEQQADMWRDDSKEKEELLREIEKKLASQEQIVLHLQERLARQQQDFEALQERSKIEFENIANRLLEEKSQKFTAQNQQQLGNILNPLREKIREFEQGIDKRFLEETKDRISLKKEIEHLRTLNEQLSSDANNLVKALKGDNKTQGDWGEIQLEILLEKAGLTRDIHYLVQASFKDQYGRDKRPDFIIKLPEDKHLVIDSKVSLVAYEQFFNSEEKEEKTAHLKAHVNSIRNHIKDLGSKNYQHLYQINSPDYLLLFIPIEPAFGVALQQDSKLFLEALDRNIVLVTTSTLLATMRTVSYIWKQEKQKKSVLEIARQSGLLYDKFVAFVEDLKSIGYRLEQTQTAYHDAMNKLTDSKKFGDTLVGRAQKIKELGAKASKRLPQEFLTNE